MNSVGINPQFFRRALNDYSRWQWAWVRELCQNAIDCGASTIEFDIKQSDTGIVVSCYNNGPPMDREVLTDKFLNLGGTTKYHDGQVGGFGLAKIVICFAHERYEVQTGDLCVSGCGGSYQIVETPFALAGTRTTVWMSGVEADEIANQVYRFASYLQFSGQIKMSGVTLGSNLRKGSPRRRFSFGQVYTNNSFPGKMVVRINGIPMFYEHIDLPKCVVVELEGRSDEVLTSNRDALCYPHSSDLRMFVRELTVDRSSALKDRGLPTYEEYYGNRILHVPAKSECGPELDGPEQDGPEQDGPELDGPELDGPELDGPQQDGPQQESLAKADKCDSDGYLSPTQVVAGTGGCLARLGKSPIGANFIIKNTTGLKIPLCYLPTNGDGRLKRWSAYSNQLALSWRNVLYQMHKHFDIREAFSVGFVFDEDALAQYERSSDRGVTYFIAPATLAKQKNSGSRSFKKAWKFDSKGKGAIIATAAHELVHGMGYKYHDEDFSSKYTQVVGDLFRAHRDFNWCFRC